MLTSGIGYKMCGWDALSDVRRAFCRGPEYVANLYIQISLWPSPRGILCIADAHAIKVSGYRHDFSKSLATNRQLSTGIVNGECFTDHLQLASKIFQASGGLQGYQRFRSKRRNDRVC